MIFICLSDLLNQNVLSENSNIIQGLYIFYRKNFHDLNFFPCVSFKKLEIGESSNADSDCRWIYKLVEKMGYNFF